MYSVLRLNAAARRGNIDELYLILTQQPTVLEIIDREPHADTPAHIAASEGQPHFALEILNLKPSFGKKLNTNGFCPLRLALGRQENDTARRLARVHPELIRVPGREMLTPLHYVAQMNQIELLAEFLLASPGSIQDLTIYEETAVHVAVKNRRLDAVMVLLGWLQRINKNKVLNWKDEDGNTVLHIAASTGQLEVIELLVNKVKINEVNIEENTALDIAMALPVDAPNKERAIMILRHARAVRATPELLRSLTTVHGFLNSPQGFLEKFVGHSQSWQIRVSGEMKNTLLVVAVLIVTATYAASLNPPSSGPSGTQSQDGNTLNINHDHMHHNSNTYFRIHFEMFMMLNAAALVTSAAVIFLVLDTGPYSKLLRGSLLLLMASYGVVAFYKPRMTTRIEFSFVLLLLITLLFKFFFSLYTSSRHLSLHSKWHEIIYQLTICKHTHPTYYSSSW